MQNSWVFLSPHLDDAVYSCGGLIAELSARGDRISVWTICAGDPPEGPLTLFARALHTRWKTGRDAVAHRRNEDRRACALVGAQTRYFDLPDCVYRRDPDSGKAYYNSVDDIFGRPDEREKATLSTRYFEELSPILNPAARLVLPLGVGSHVDHQLVRLVGERVCRSPWYYAEVPYALDEATGWDDLLPPAGAWRTYPVSEASLHRWISASAAYESQLSSFWKDQDQMAASLKAFHDRFSGNRLWGPDTRS